MNETTVTNIDCDMGQFDCIAKEDDIAGFSGVEGDFSCPLILVSGYSWHRHAHFPMRVIHQAAAIEPFVGMIAAVTVGGADHALRQPCDVLAR